MPVGCRPGRSSVRPRLCGLLAGAEIDSCISAARALLTPALLPAPGPGSACGAGRSIRSQLPPAQAACVRASARASLCFCLPRWGPNLQASLCLALSWRLSPSTFLPRLRRHPPPSSPALGHAELASRGRDMSLNRCRRQNAGLSATKAEAACMWPTEVTPPPMQRGQTPAARPPSLLPTRAPNPPLYLAKLPQPLGKSCALVPGYPSCPTHRRGERGGVALPDAASHCRAPGDPLPGQEGAGSAQAAGEESGPR